MTRMVRRSGSVLVNSDIETRSESIYLIEVTYQPRATADLHIRDPRNPLPPATTSFFFAA